MNYFETTRQVSDFQVKRAIDNIYQSFHFELLVKHNNLKKADLSKIANHLSRLIGALSSLVATEDSKTFYAFDRPGGSNLEAHNYSNNEKKFIKINSISYRYLRGKFEGVSTDKIISEGLIEEYFLACVLLGIVSSDSAYSAGYDLSNTDPEKAYKLLINFSAPSKIPTPALKLIKPIVNHMFIVCFNADNFPKKLNFLQERAIKMHGLSYVNLGSQIARINLQFQSKI